MSLFSDATGVNIDVASTGQNALGGLGKGGMKAAPDATPAKPPGPTEQQLYAKSFQERLPQMQAKMAQQLTQQSNQQMQGALQQNKQANFSRGMGYGGIEQGQQAGIRVGSEQQLAGQISGANASLENASNTLNAQAVETGVGVQQTEQSIQNSIYQQQMANQQANNNITGSIMGTAMMAAILLA